MEEQNYDSKSPGRKGTCPGVEESVGGHGARETAQPAERQEGHLSQRGGETGQAKAVRGLSERGGLQKTVAELNLSFVFLFFLFVGGKGGPGRKQGVARKPFLRRK